MGIVTLIEKILHLILWGFRKPLHRARFARLDELTSITSGNPDPTSLLIGVNRFKKYRGYGKKQACNESAGAHNRTFHYNIGHHSDERVAQQELHSVSL